MPAPAKQTQDKGERQTLTKILREFKGVNTKNDRTAIPAENFYDLINLMPIGSANLHSIPNISAALATFGVTVYRFQYANINNLDYLICFATNGSVIAYAIAAQTTTTIAAAGTLSGAGSKLDQWKNQAILVVDTNGYFAWDGTTWSQINTGANKGILPSSPLVSPDIAVYNGYVWLYSNRVLYVSCPNQYGPTAGTALTTTGTFASGSTSITVARTQSALGNIVAGSTVTGLGIASSTTVSTIDYNTGAITLNNATTGTGPFTVQTTAVFSSGDSSMTVASATNLIAGAYITYSGTGGGLAGNTQIGLNYVPGATLVPMTIAATGNHGNSNYVFTYSQNLTFSTTQSGWDLSGGALIQNLTDPQFRGQVTRMLSANGYLYLFTKSSIFVISDVYIPSGAVPPSPVFSIVNVQALIGSDQQMSVFALDRRLYFANTYGLYALEGVTAKRVSEDIDGTIQYLDTTFPISGGTTQVWNIAQACFLIKQVNDPVFGTRTILACHFDNKWWFYQPPTGCTFVGSGMDGNSGNVPCIFALIGSSLYRLFADTSASPAGSWKTSLWAMDDSLSDKEVFRAGFEATSPTGVTSTFTLNLDTPLTSASINPTSATSTVSLINNAGLLVSLQNNSNQIVLLFTGTYLLYFGDGLGGYGKYVGLSGTFTAGSPIALTSNAMDYTLRKRW